MSKFAVKLVNGKTIEVHADSADAAMAHAKAAADSHREKTMVGPASEGRGMPNQVGKHADPVRADAEQPVSATQIK